MTTQEIKNMNLDKTQVSKMMLGSYQVWPHVEIDYGPEVPEIEGDYLVFATYGEADISFKACGVTRDYFSGQLDFNVIYSYDGIIWNDFGYSYTLADENENHKVYTFDKVHITKDTPVYIKRSTPGTLLTPSYISLLDETPLGLDNYDNGVYDIPMNPDDFIDEHGQTFSFTMSGDYVFCSGKLKAWMDLDLFNFDVRPWYADFPYFAQLFRGCTKLRTANIEFQFNYLWKNMYNCMFLDCTSLIAGPKIFDFSNIKYTYFDTERNDDKEYVQDYRNAFWLMFAGCTSLIKTPQFVGEFITREGCFCSMFKNCKSLIIPTSLKNISCISSPDNAFNAMFKGCTSLIKIPELPNVDRVGPKMYSRMFEGCTSLTTVPILPATKLLGAKCYEYMFKDCTSLVKAPELPATELSDYCYQYMFDGCTSLTKAPKLPAQTLSYACYSNMFKNCTSLTTAPELHATTLVSHCYNSMFDGCTSLVKAPELPATTIEYYCYERMFRNCASLKYVKMMATNLKYYSYLAHWLDGVSETGTFVKNKYAKWSNSEIGIPEGWTVITE